MECNKIIQGMEKGQLKLKEALQAPLPTKMLHLFACDCAERALIQERLSGNEPDARCWNAVETKREWIHQKASDQERSNALEGAKQAADLAWDRVKWTERRSALRPGYRAVWITEKAYWSAADSAVKSALLDAYRAASYASLRSLETAEKLRYRLVDEVTKIRDQEVDWQRKRLLWLLSLYQFAGERWVSIAPGGITPAAVPPEVSLLPAS